MAVVSFWCLWLKLQDKQGRLRCAAWGQGFIRRLLGHCGANGSNLPYRELLLVLNEVYKGNLHLIKRSRTFLKGLCWPDGGFVDQDVNTR